MRAAQRLRPNSDDVDSPETYLGDGGAENFASPGGAIKDAPHVYAASQLQPQSWVLAGDWTSETSALF